MGISKAKLGKFVRGAAVSGLLGAAGLVYTASPALAQDVPSDPSDPPSDTSDPSDPGVVAEGTTTGGVAAEDTETDGGALAATGIDPSGLLLIGGGSAAVALAIRRVARG